MVLIENTKTHLFAKLDGNVSENTSYKVEIQNVTNDNYLKIHDIKEYTPLIDSESTNIIYRLESNIDENTNLDSTIKLYEDLSKEDNDKYQYMFQILIFQKMFN